MDCFSDGTSTAITATVTSLSNGITDYFRVKASNSVGSGSPRASVSSDLVVPLLAPTGSSITGTSRSTTELLWTAPVHDGRESVDDYRIQQSTDGSPWAPANEVRLRRVGPDLVLLSNGMTYYLLAAAENAEGIGPHSDSMSATPTASQ